MRLARAIAPLALAMLLAPAGAPLQAQQQPDAIPTLLVHGLLRNPVEGITIGTLPPGWPTDLAPGAWAQVVGGYHQPGGTLVAVFADSSAPLLPRYQKQLEDAGWARPVPSPAEGFTPSGSPSELFCRDSLRVRPYALRRIGGPHLLHVIYFKSGVPCTRVSSAPRLPPRAAALAVPSLSPPIGASITLIGRQYGQSVSTSAMLVDSTRSAAALVSHFAAQLVAAGWTVAPPVSDSRLAASALEAKDATGATWRGVLLIHSRTGERHSATLTMDPMEDR